MKTFLGRVLRDIERKCLKPDRSLDSLLDVGTRKRYEFGCKAIVAATSRGGWFLGAMALHDNPYDGHTLTDALPQVERIVAKPEHVFVDMGYRGHGYDGDIDIHVDKRTRGRSAKSLWRWMKRRTAIESGIGHSYSPELNPDEYLNGDLKAGVHSTAPARSKTELKSKALSHLRMLQKMPNRVAKYFEHPKIAYAA